MIQAQYERRLALIEELYQTNPSRYHRVNSRNGILGFLLDNSKPSEDQIFVSPVFSNILWAISEAQALGILNVTREPDIAWDEAFIKVIIQASSTKKNP